MLVKIEIDTVIDDIVTEACKKISSNTHSRLYKEKHRFLTYDTTEIRLMILDFCDSKNEQLSIEDIDLYMILDKGVKILYSKLFTDLDKENIVKLGFDSDRMEFVWIPQKKQS